MSTVSLTISYSTIEDGELASLQSMLNNSTAVMGSFQCQQQKRVMPCFVMTEAFRGLGTTGPCAREH